MKMRRGKETLDDSFLSICGRKELCPNDVSCSCRCNDASHLLSTLNLAVTCAVAYDAD